MDNTTSYLQKEIDTIEVKIKDAKDTLLHELGLDLFDSDNGEIVSGCRVVEHARVEKAIKEAEEEDEEEDEEL